MCHNQVSGGEHSSVEEACQFDYTRDKRDAIHFRRLYARFHLGANRSAVGAENLILGLPRSHAARKRAVIAPRTCADSERVGANDKIVEVDSDGLRDLRSAATVSIVDQVALGCSASQSSRGITRGST